jgi:hypothetical protein
MMAINRRDELPDNGDIRLRCGTVCLYRKDRQKYGHQQSSGYMAASGTDVHCDS